MAATAVEAVLREAGSDSIGGSEQEWNWAHATRSAERWSARRMASSKPASRGTRNWFKTTVG
jgi:hypothetical protein